MTDKQIIIDGIDVSGCEYFGSQENCTIRTHQKCINYPNCIYKQLKRKEQELAEKEQECKKLEKQLDDCNTIIDRFLIASGKSKDINLPEEFEEVFEDIEQTYSECEELKVQLKQVKYLYEVQDEKLVDELATENKKYKQALAEIEKILDTRHKQGQCFCDIRLPLILDIINKAKEK